MPREAVIGRPKDVSDETRRGRVDVAIGPDESSWDRTYPRDDAIVALPHYALRAGICGRPNIDL